MLRSLLIMGLLVPPRALSAQTPDSLYAGSPAVDASRGWFGEQMQQTFSVRDGNSTRGPLARRSVDRIRHGVEGRIRYTLRVETARGLLIDSTVARSTDLAPVRHSSTFPARDMTLHFEGRTVRGTYEPADSAATSFTHHLDVRPFDSATLDLVIAALPLEAGYRAVLPMYIYERGGTVWTTLEVIGREELRLGSESRPAWRVELRGWRPVTYWIDAETREPLGSDFQLPERRIVTRTLTGEQRRELALAVLDSTVAALGGPALRALRAMRYSAIAVTNALEQSERPDGPWIKVFMEHEVLLDLAHRQVRRTSRQRSSVWASQWTPPITLIADSAAAAISRGERTGPAQLRQRREAMEQISLSPLRLPFTAMGSRGLRIGMDSVIDGVRNRRVLFELEDRTVHLFIDANTWIPSGFVLRGKSPGIYDYVWGDVDDAVWYSVWWLYESGLRFPLIIYREFNGRPREEISVTDVDFDPAAPRDSFAISPEVREQHQSLPHFSIEDATLGRGWRGPVDPLEVAPGVTVHPGSWYVTVVRQEDGTAVIEAPISSSYSAQVIADAEARYGSVVRAVTTSDAWPHVAGVREYVARGVSLHVLDLNESIVRDVLSSDYLTDPDSLQRAPREPSLEIIRERTEVGSGVNRFELIPVRGEGGERMMLAYFPGHRLLYASDLIQRDQSGNFFAPQYLEDVARAVQGHGLIVDTVFAMHTDPLPWEEVLAAIP